MEQIPSSIRELRSCAYAPGEVLLAEKAKSDRLLFLISGSVAVSKEGVLIARVREPGAVFGEMSVLLNSPYTATVTAVSDVECRVSDAPLEFLTDHPEVMLYVGRMLARRLESLNRYLLDVKGQFRDMEGHLGMVDEVLDTLMNRHPREIVVPADPGQ